MFSNISSINQETSQPCLHPLNFSQGKLCSICFYRYKLKQLINIGSSAFLCQNLSGYSMSEFIIMEMLRSTDQIARAMDATTSVKIEAISQKEPDSPGHITRRLYCPLFLAFLAHCYKLLACLQCWNMRGY